MIAALATPPALAQAQMINFSIRSQDLPSALRAFGRQSSEQVVFDSAVMEGRTSTPVMGRLKPVQAMRLLLTGTSFEAKVGSRGEFIVRAASKSPASAGARPAVESPLAKGSPSARVEEVIVTATRRSQTEESVPAALTVVRGSQLDERNIKTLNDIENSVPGVEVTSQLGSGQSQFRIRGIGLTDYADNNSGTAGVYIDEVENPYSVTYQGSLFDINRIELLRGPQGTLFGRNTTAGVVSISTNEPTRKFDAGLDTDYGSFDALQMQGFASGPLTDTVQGRIAFNVNEGGAWQYNRTTGQQLGDENKKDLRFKLAWEPSATTQVYGSVHYDRDQSDGLGLQLRKPFQSHAFAPLGPFYPADSNPRETGWGISPEFASLTGEPNNAKPNVNNEGYGGSVRLKNDFGWAELTTIVAHEWFNRKEFDDFDATSSNEGGEYFFNKIQTQSEEIRLATPAAKRLRALAGFFRSDESNNGGFLSDFTDVSSLRDIFDSRYGQMVASTGVFGDVDYDLNRRLTFTLGGRIEYEARRLRNFQSRTVYPVDRLLVAVNENLDREEPSGKAEIAYHLNSQVLAYAQVSYGVKSGGFTTYNSGLPGQIAPFQPEKLLSYEPGVRSEFFNHTLRINGSLFYYDYRDQQLQGVIFTQTQRIGKIINVPRSHLYGGELEVIWKPIPALEISQAISYKTGRYDRFFFINSAATIAARDPVTGDYNTIVSSNQRGGLIPNIPREEYQGEASYTLTSFGWEVVPEINYSYRSGQFTTTSNTVIPQYWLVNCNLTFRPPGAHYTFGGYLNNATDSRYIETENAFVTAATLTPHEVRTYGVRLTYRY